MLVLSRKVGEEIILPDCGVTIGVLGVVGKRVRLGIAAPQDVPVHRKEALRRICAEAAGEELLDDEPSAARTGSRPRLARANTLAIKENGRTDL